MKLTDAIKIAAQIEAERDAIQDQKAGDTEAIPPIHTRLWGRKKRIEITIVDEDK